MTPPLHDEIRALARSLSKAQRKWLAGDGAGVLATKRLIELGLIRKVSVGMYEILALGMQVRAHLLQENDHVR
jgi:hypothetical protein